MTTEVRSVLAPLVLCLGLALPLAAESTDAVVGDWRGVLTVQGTELPIVFMITNTDSVLGASMVSPAQSTAEIPADSVIFEAGRIEIKIAAIGGGYSGALGEDGTLSGTLSQGGQSWPLNFERADEQIALGRPQVPSKPYPYEEEEVRVATPDPEVTLAGTLTRLPGDEPVTSVVLITGSGPQDRDESIMGHQPFLVLADHLTRQGLAVLRLDDRGVGESTGNFTAATTLDFADDITAAVAYLRQRSDTGRIGLIGHSEGGLVAPIVANGSADVDFVVLLAGPGLPGEEILYRQSRLIIQAGGGSQEDADKNHQLQKAMFDAIKEEGDTTKLQEKLRNILADTAGTDDTDAKAAIEAQVAQLSTSWFKTFLTYDPVPALRKLDCPVLAVNGEKDTQVPPKENLAAIRAALQAGKNSDFQLVELEGLNHLFQTAETGAPSEYGKIDETLSPRALNVVSSWILERFDTRAGQVPPSPKPSQ